jgi:hypothetical protein
MRAAVEAAQRGGRARGGGAPARMRAGVAGARAVLALLAACGGGAKAPAVGGESVDTAAGADTAPPPTASGSTEGTPPDRDLDGFDADHDCDDGDSDSYPGALELCGDGVINNCEERGVLGEVEGCVAWGPRDAVTAMRAGYDGNTDPGVTVVPVGDVDGDGTTDLGVGHSYMGWTEEVYDPELGDTVLLRFVYGGLSVMSGPLPSTDGTPISLVDLSSYTLGPTEGEPVGTGLGGIGDLDGDGYDDLVVGDEQTNDGLAPDHAWLIWGPGAISDWAADTLPLWTGPNRSCALARPGRAGDLTGDGAPDLLLNDRCADTVYLLSGADLRAGVAEPAVEVFEPGAIWYGFGHAVDGTADLTGDGLADLVVGAPLRERDLEVLTDLGFVAIFEGPLRPGSSGALSTADAYARFEAEPKTRWEQERRFGNEVSTGDMNGDGYADLALGDPKNSRGDTISGVAYVFAGPLLPSAQTSDAAFTLLGEAYSGRGAVGGEVDLSQDLDGDGRADLFTSGGLNLGELGGPGGTYGATDYGWVVRAPLAGTLRERYADLILHNPDVELWGFQSMSTPDLSGDGRPDLLIGGPANSIHLFEPPW